VGTRALRLVVLILLATACSRNTAREALGSLKSENLSPKYHSGFWADEAGQQTALWKEAQQACKGQEPSPTPNCRVVFAVDTTVRIIAVRQDEDLGERLKAWIRSGTRELGLSRVQHAAANQGLRTRNAADADVRGEVTP
jgi:hypothetical protein